MLMKSRVSVMASLLWVGLVGTTTMTSAVAQDAYPSKSIRIIVPFSAGGGTDVLGREVGQKMSSKLGVPVVVENLAGASTVIGADKVAKSPPDGYTILITTTTTFATNPHTLKSMPFSIDDFEGVSLLAQNPLVLAAPASAIYNTPKDLVEYARANPGKLSYGTQGRGATAHFVGEMIAAALGIKMTDISYKGSTPGLVDLSGGQIPLLVDGTVASLPLVKAGRIKLIGVTSSERLSAAPNVPTFVESGYPEMVADFKTAMFVPKGTPQSVIDKLNTAVQYALSDKALVDRYGQNGTMVKGSDPRETVQTFKRDREMYGRLIERTGLKFD